MHGKPEISDEVTLNEDGCASLYASWVVGLDPAHCITMYDQTKVFEAMLFDAFDIGATESMSFAVAPVR